MKRLLLTLGLSLLILSSYAEERILSYDVNMTLNTGGSARVEEKITVNAEGNQIKRGIFRDLPLQKNSYQDFTLTRNGRMEPFFTERQPGFKRVNFGDDNFIPKGVHTYVFGYTASDVASFFKNYDEVYWNAVGTEWAFGVERASFTLTLPPGAQVLEGKISLYTGPKGSTAQNAARAGSGLTFFTTRPLGPGEGFTVAVPFEKGLITQSRAAKFRGAGLILAPLFTLFMCALMFFTWRKFGDDPVHPVVIAEYEPPDGINAAMAGYVYSAGHMQGGEILCVEIINLATKNALSISKEGLFAKHFVLTPNAENYASLNHEEQRFYDHLFFLGNAPLALNKQYNHLRQFTKEFAKEYKNSAKKYFEANAFLNIIIMLILGAVSAVLAYFEAGLDAQFCIVTSLFTVMMTGMARRFASTIDTRKKFTLQHLQGAVGFIFFAVFIFLLFTTSGLGIERAGVYTSSLALLSVGAGAFGYAIRKFTPAGLTLYHHLRGFRHYLEIGEGGRVAMSNAEEGAEVFCSYLPYAVALGAENKWAKKFERALATPEGKRVMARHGLASFTVGAFSAGAFARALSSGLSSAADSASGAGGSGSSGGGGGGGGGGGR